MEKDCNKGGSMLGELEKFASAVSDEVEEICEAFAQKGMFDEYSDGTFLDAFITYKYGMIRNELQRQHLRHLHMIEEMEIAVQQN